MKHGYTILHNIKLKRGIVQFEEFVAASDKEMQEIIKTARQEHDKITVMAEII